MPIVIDIPLTIEMIVIDGNLLGIGKTQICKQPLIYVKPMNFLENSFSNNNSTLSSFSNSS
jgi:hypothetical protein